MFAIATIVLLLAPLVFMPFFNDDSSHEKRELAPVPQLVVDGKPNLYVLSDAGNYLADHFAFRTVLVDVDASIKQGLFMTSSTSNVVVGSNGWLYYSGTLNDYQRRNRMSDQALKNAAYNLALTQEYFESQGKSFVLAIAPNKNELYPQNMPYYEMAGEGQTNFERLTPLLDELGVKYVNLHEAFRKKGEVLYFARDSHWTDEGAMLAYDEIMRALGREPLASLRSERLDNAHAGDIDGMLHPAFAAPEHQQTYDFAKLHQITNEAASVEDNYIITKGAAEGAQGNLLMYRDSFGNNLLLPFACSYSQAVFTKLVPYDMSARMCGFANDVVVERTERHLAFFATNPPYVPALERSVDYEDAAYQGTASVFASENGPYAVIEGSIDNNSANAVEHIYVSVQKADGTRGVYQAFRVSQDTEGSSDFEGDASQGQSHVEGDSGFCCYLPKDQVAIADGQEIEVIASGSQGVYRMNRA